MVTNSCTFVLDLIDDVLGVAFAVVILVEPEKEISHLDRLTDKLDLIRGCCLIINKLYLLVTVHDVHLMVCKAAEVERLNLAVNRTIARRERSYNGTVISITMDVSYRFNRIISVKGNYFSSI